MSAPLAVRRVGVAVAAAVLLVLLAWVLPPFRDYQLAEVAVYAIAIAGLTLLTGYNGQISLGHGALMAIGAYTTGLVMKHWGWPLSAALVAATIVTAVGGALVGAVAARLRGPYLAGATLALAVALPDIANHWSSFFGGNTGIGVNAAAPASLGLDFPVTRWQSWLATSWAVLGFLLLANVARSRVGRTLRAVRDDEVSASLSGLNVARLQVIAYVISAGAAGLGGGLLAMVVTLVSPGSFTIALSLTLLTAAILGGMTSLAGAVWGALVIVYVPAWLANVAAPTTRLGQYLPLLVYGLVLIAVMRFAPYGIHGGLARAGTALRRVPGVPGRIGLPREKRPA